MFLESLNTLNPFVLLQGSASMPLSSEDKIVIKHYRVDKHDTGVPQKTILTLYILIIGM